jgi:SAM-dependent methyltransferase
MGQRTEDGSAGDADYGTIGSTYSRYRRPDPRIAAVIAQALGEARTVLNVGAGPAPTSRRTGRSPPSSPRPRCAPSVRRISRPRWTLTAEQLPFPDDSFDAAMTTFSVHQWQDLPAGLAELRRVTRGPVVVLTCDPMRVEEFWLREYAPEVLVTEARRYPHLDALANGLGGRVSISTVLIPQGCTDGFTEAYYGRPERLLDVEAQLACSAWSLVEPEVIEGFTRSLAGDLLDGTWDARHGALRTLPAYEGSLVMLVAEP